MRVSLFLLVIVCSAVSARQVDTRPYSDDELWRKSSEVAIVQVIEGRFDPESRVFEVTADVHFAVKGGFESDVSFVGKAPMTVPQSLGGFYLVHLRRLEDGQLHALESENAVIELYNLVSTGDEAGDRELWDSSVNIAEVVRFGKEPYTPVTCRARKLTNSLHCSPDVTTLLLALNKYKLRGRPYRPPQL